MGPELVNWREALSKHWSSLRFGSATVETQGNQYSFQVQAYLDDLDPEVVRVELYAEGRNGDLPVRRPMNRGNRLQGAVSGFVYSAQIPATRPVADYTPRLVPFHDGVAVPLESPFILWHDSPSWR